MVASEDTVVVIEDDHHISDLVAMYLRRDGFRVLQADDGEAGLAIVDREDPMLVIVDIGLPGELDGFDVCRRLADDVRTHPERCRRRALPVGHPGAHPQRPGRRGGPGAGPRARGRRLRDQAVLGP